MSKLSDRHSRHDRFHRQAKAAGYRSRAIYKLEQIDQRFQLFAPGGAVLDLGCAPGSWLQYAARRVGPQGHLVGLDRKLIDLCLPNLRLLAGDVYEISREELLGDLSAFDVVLSDMAPDTIGVRHVDQLRSTALFEQALAVAVNTLRPGGHFVGKLFQGPGFTEVVKECRRLFEAVKIVKPEGSRSASIEQYVVCRGFRAPPTGDAT